MSDTDSDPIRLAAEGPEAVTWGRPRGLGMSEGWVTGRSRLRRYRTSATCARARRARRAAASARRFRTSDEYGRAWGATGRARRAPGRGGLDVRRRPKDPLGRRQGYGPPRLNTVAPG